MGCGDWGVGIGAPDETVGGFAATGKGLVNGMPSLVPGALCLVVGCRGCISPTARQCRRRRCSGRGVFPRPPTVPTIWPTCEVLGQTSPPHSIPTTYRDMSSPLSQIQGGSAGGYLPRDEDVASTRTQRGQFPTASGTVGRKPFSRIARSSSSARSSSYHQYGRTASSFWAGASTPFGMPNLFQ